MKTVVLFLLFAQLHDQNTSTHQDYSESVGGIEFVMKAIPAGRYWMGCGMNDKPCTDENHMTFHSHIKKNLRLDVDAFYLAETETTWALYQQCIFAKACSNNDSDGGDNGWGKADRPVIEVSWNDVTTEFIPWLNKMTKKHYRLPTEKEWEYAARANTNSKYSWGDDIDCHKARYGYMSKECGGIASTTPVKSYPPNNFGLYDMHGNVWEFVQNCWSEDITETPVFADKRACSEVVIRGGSWLNKAFYLRSAARYSHDRSYRESGDGFRLAMDAMDK